MARNEMYSDTLYIVGPGTTTRALMIELGLDFTLLGVDVVYNGKLIAKDVSEETLLKLCSRYKKIKLIVTPIGGQGFLFGRGNQQISPRVLRFFSRNDIFILSTPAKLHALEGAPLLMDTGDATIDQILSGYIRIVTGFNEFVMYAISAM